MAEHILTVPDLGETAGTEATVSFWHCKEGQVVNADDDIVEMTYDKATFYVPSPVTGVVKKILAAENTTVPIGAKLVIIETDEASESS